MGLVLSCSSSFAETWPWRGPTGNGIASVNQQVVSQWSESTNVVWKVDVPGRGHSSPVVRDDRIFLTTADEIGQTQSVVCYELNSGKQLWITQCHEGGFLKKIHPKNTHASSTVAFDDAHAYAVFCHKDSVHVTCLDFDGAIVWQKRVGSWIPALYQFGFGQSPIVHEGKVIVTAESDSDPFIMALHPNSGKLIWKIERPRITSYGTPVVATLAGKPQLLIGGGRNLTAYDPATGNELWMCDVSWSVACGTIVWCPELGMVYASGGYPTKQTVAVKADGTSSIAWENRIKCYEQSLLVVDDCVYGHAEGGVLYCWDAATGEQLWVERLGGSESASPIFADGKIFLTNEEGKTWVIRPSREKFDLVATNQLGDEMFASIGVVNNRLLLRVADRKTGSRREHLYCLGQP